MTVSEHPFSRTYITRHTFLYLVFTVFANHVAGQPPVKRMLRSPVIWHSGKRPWNTELKLSFIFRTFVFSTTIPHFWIMVTKVTGLKHVLSHWQIINFFFFLQLNRCISVQYRQQSINIIPLINKVTTLWIFIFQNGKKHTSCSAAYLLLGYCWLLQRKIKDFINPTLETNKY